MSDFSKKVNLMIIDPEEIKIEKSYEFATAHILILELDSTPDDRWLTIFEQEWKKSSYHLKRRVSIVKNTLRVVTAPDEVKGKIEWIKGLIGSINNRIERHNEEARREEKAELRRRQEEKETIDKMRELLR